MGSAYVRLDYCHGVLTGIWGYGVRYVFVVAADIEVLRDIHFLSIRVSYATISLYSFFFSSNSKHF